MAPVENKKIHHDQLNHDFETTAPPADETTTKSAAHGDYDGMLREKKQMYAYASAMVREYESLKNQAPAIKKWTEAFTKTSVSAAFAVAQLALFEAPEIESVKGLVRELALEIAKDQIAEKSAEKAAHAVAE